MTHEGERTSGARRDGAEPRRGEPRTLRGFMQAVARRQRTYLEDHERVEAVLETPQGRLTLSVHSNGDYFLLICGPDKEADTEDVAVQGQVFQDGTASVVAVVRDRRLVRS